MDPLGQRKISILCEKTWDMFILSQVLGSSTLSGSYRFWTQPTETSSDRMGGGFDELGGTWMSQMVSKWVRTPVYPIYK